MSKRNLELGEEEERKKDKPMPACGGGRYVL